MLLATRSLLVCAVWLLISFVPAKASTGSEAIVVNPLVGRAGDTVTVIGTGWREHGTRGIDVPIWIGFANEVARGHPAVNGTFIVQFNIPSSSPEGELTISAIIGNGGSADALYIVSATRCADAYLIGLHGMLQGPDSRDDTLQKSQEIAETGRILKTLKPNNRTLALDSLNYHVPATWNIPEIPQGVPPAVAALSTKIAEVRSGCATQSFVLVGYSFGAWVIEEWLSENRPLWNLIKAVEVYGDPLWCRSAPDCTYGGLARRWLQLGQLQEVDPDPYRHTPPGYDEPLQNRWQSLCLARDPVCGEGYGQGDFLGQHGDAVSCVWNFCEHKKYALSPEPGRTGYGVTRFGAETLALTLYGSTSPHRAATTYKLPASIRRLGVGTNTQK